MKLVVAAVGQRQPAWTDAAWADFAKRFPPELRVELKAVKAEPRASGKTPAQMMTAEAERLEAAVPRGALRIALDERGERIATAQLAQRIDAWRREGRDIAFLIGGPDGLSPALKDVADERWRLSDLTLPHAFARVLLLEALYRAWTVTTGHPYHRE
ncbi:MAG TPA: 23S rRNA (pseudouridine(1915)-N(3))-methyltransferase RlmH [Caldimonas sp.]|nr:23S rRNA (pseudouridine(1915)-N(3))-methyltransferase RlmH [Caldimonas sp.]